MRRRCMVAREVNGEQGDSGEGTMTFHPTGGAEVSVASSFSDKMD